MGASFQCPSQPGANQSDALLRNNVLSLTTDENEYPSQSSQYRAHCVTGPLWLGSHNKSMLAVNSDFPPELGVCCLAWDLTDHEQMNATEERFLDFQNEIAKCVQFFNSIVLSHDAACGLVAGRSMTQADMTAADTLVRLGQLLCRWAVVQSPPFGLRVGVGVGSVENLGAVGDGRLYFGSACTEARRLAAEMPGQGPVVHMAGSVLEQLRALRPLHFTISSTPYVSYCLEPSTEVLSRTPKDSDPHELEVPMVDDLPLSGTPEERMQAMPFAKFKDLLRTHQIPVSRFGYGNAKTLQEFYDAVVRDAKSSLVIRDGRLERVVELVRISLRVRDGSNRLLEMRIKSDQVGWNTRVRNQPLAMVIHQSDHGRWQDAVDRCFEVKFGLDAKLRKDCLTMDREAYRFQEERAKSDTIPGIMTTYKTHNIVINVRDKTKAELQRFGLPDACEFTSDTEKRKRVWTWAPVHDDKEEELATILQRGGIDLAEFAWQAFAELCEEVYDKRQSSIELNEGSVVRIIKIVRIQLHADIFNLDHVLVVRSKQQKGQQDAAFKGRLISMRMSVGQTWEEAVRDALTLRLGISEKDQECNHIEVDPASHRVVEEIGYSRSYPGLKSLYMINEVSVRILNSHDQHFAYMGLPGGTDFKIIRTEQMAQSDDKAIIATEWGWQLSSEVNRNPAGGEERETRPSLSDPEPRIPPRSSVLQIASENPVIMRCRVKPPKSLVVRSTDELLLSKLMLGKKTDWLRAHRAAARILDPEYTTRDFYDDIVEAFPELRLYCIARSGVQDGQTIGNDVIAGGARTVDDEYQRTIGALFTIFWLMRLHIDGRECFCFGLDNNWKPKLPNLDLVADGIVDRETQRRQTFLESTDWQALTTLVVGAGLLEKYGGPHDEERTLAFLVLMAIHDIMKIDVLLPTVSMGMTEFCGYKSGETISDHDVGLSYVLETCPNALPSFAGLSKAQQESIKFAHCKLEYNMGWLVQAEAPPYHLFKAFRNVIISGNASASDIAFYFVHWFCDLAGAEPAPMQGSEKFVLKFPQKVLGNFISSFPVVWTLGVNTTETQVLEEYLVWRWTNHDPKLGSPPNGPGSIAMMRLMLMAQGDSHEVLRNFMLLPDDDRQVLSEEMAMTGCVDQNFTRDSLKGAKYDKKGPAFLVYYAPALMQKAGRANPRDTLIILAEVFRQARELWPLVPAVTEANRSVSVRIDSLKDLMSEQILEPEEGHCFVLHKKSSQDGMVELMNTASLRKVDWSTHQILSFEMQRGRRRNLLGTAYSTMTRMLSGPRGKGSKERAAE